MQCISVSLSSREHLFSYCAHLNFEFHTSAQHETCIFKHTLLSLCLFIFYNKNIPPIFVLKTKSARSSLSIVIRIREQTKWGEGEKQTNEIGDRFGNEKGREDIGEGLRIQQSIQLSLSGWWDIGKIEEKRGGDIEGGYGLDKAAHGIASLHSHSRIPTIFPLFILILCFTHPKWIFSILLAAQFDGWMDGWILLHSVQI